MSLLGKLMNFVPIVVANPFLGLFGKQQEDASQSPDIIPIDAPDAELNGSPDAAARSSGVLGSVEDFTVNICTAESEGPCIEPKDLEEMDGEKKTKVLEYLEDQFKLDPKLAKIARDFIQGMEPEERAKFLKKMLEAPDRQALKELLGEVLTAIKHTVHELFGMNCDCHKETPPADPQKAQNEAKNQRENATQTINKIAKDEGGLDPHLREVTEEFIKNHTNENGELDEAAQKVLSASEGNYVPDSTTGSEEGSDSKESGTAPNGDANSGSDDALVNNIPVAVPIVYADGGPVGAEAGDASGSMGIASTNSEDEIPASPDSPGVPTDESTENSVGVASATGEQDQGDLFVQAALGGASSVFPADGDSEESAIYYVQTNDGLIPVNADGTYLISILGLTGDGQTDSPELVPAAYPGAAHAEGNRNAPIAFVGTNPSGEDTDLGSTRLVGESGSSGSFGDSFSDSIFGWISNGLATAVSTSLPGAALVHPITFALAAVAGAMGSRFTIQPLLQPEQRFVAGFNAKSANYIASLKSRGDSTDQFSGNKNGGNSNSNPDGRESEDQSDAQMVA